MPLKKLIDASCACLPPVLHGSILDERYRRIKFVLNFEEKMIGKNQALISISGINRNVRIHIPCMMRVRKSIPMHNPVI
jgi:hypothetical protein